MGTPSPFRGLGRRQILLAAASAAVPAGAAATLSATAAGPAIFTPGDLAQRFARQVTRRLQLPEADARLYGGIAELELVNQRHQLMAPQYLLVVDANPQVQAAMLFWRLLPGCWEVIGASPASTGAAGGGQPLTPNGLFEQAGGAEAPGACGTPAQPACGTSAMRVYDFGWQRTRLPSGSLAAAPVRLQLRCAARGDERRLGRACSDGCILVPASLISFLDEFGVLDAAAQGSAAVPPPRRNLPYRGRHLLVVDSEREDRPDWSPAPAA